MKLYICTTIQQEKATGGEAKIRTAIFFISCCNIAPHLWLSFLKTILVSFFFQLGWIKDKDYFEGLTEATEGLNKDKNIRINEYVQKFEKVFQTKIHPRFK